MWKTNRKGLEPRLTAVCPPALLGLLLSVPGQNSANQNYSQFSVGPKGSILLVKTSKAPCFQLAADE